MLVCSQLGAGAVGRAIVDHDDEKPEACGLGDNRLQAFVDVGLGVVGGNNDLQVKAGFFQAVGHARTRTFVGPKLRKQVFRLLYTRLFAGSGQMAKTSFCSAKQAQERGNGVVEWAGKAKPAEEKGGVDVHGEVLE